MREMKVRVASLVVAVVSGMGVPGFAQSRDATSDSPKILLTATLDLLQPPFAGAVERITAEGEMRVGPYKGKPGKEVPPNGPLAEGLYLGVVRGTWKDLRDAQLIRVDVTEVLADGKVVAKVGRGLDGIMPLGNLILLVRPPQATTEEMRALPDLVTLEEGPVPTVAAGEADPGTKLGAATAARADRAARNLSAIAKALIGYEEAYGCFPPAALIGPDGRAWHSWRVLILRFFDDPALREIFGRYSLEEPWDGPRNKQLLDTMPAVYTDEPEDKRADAFTRFAVVTGEGTMFSPDGVAFDPAVKPWKFGRGTRFSDIGDAAAFTLMVGTLGSDARIPWMKPEDVVIRKEPMPLGKKGFFGTPYESDGGRGFYALCARADGGLAGISESIDPAVFRALTTIAGRENIDISKTPGVFLVSVSGPAGTGDSSSPPQAARGRKMTVVIFEEGGATRARSSH